MAGEVNGAGKLIYGFDWGTPSGLPRPGVGNYRLVFTVGATSLVTLDQALLGDGTQTPLHTPYVYGDKVSYLDIGVGTPLLSPALPFPWPVPKVTPRTDLNGDGNADVLARNSTGTLYLYPGDGASGWLPRRQVGTGWNGMTAIVGPGDFNRDGLVDVLARDTTGALYLYSSNPHFGWLPRRQVGTGWDTMTALAGPGDFSGDGFVDVLARNGYGQLLLYRGNGAAGWLLPPSLIGSGWNTRTIVS